MSGHMSTPAKFPVSGHFDWRVLDARAGYGRRIPPAATNNKPRRSGAGVGATGVQRSSVRVVYTCGQSSDCPLTLGFVIIAWP